MRRCIVTYKESSWGLQICRKLPKRLLLTLAEPRCSAYLNSVLELEKANPHGTQGSLVIINFCSFLRVLSLHPLGQFCGCQPSHKRYSIGLRKSQMSMVYNSWSFGTATYFPTLPCLLLPTKQNSPQPFLTFWKSDSPYASSEVGTAQQKGTLGNFINM